MSNQDLLVLFPELKFPFKYLTTEEQLAVFTYIKNNPINLDDVDDPPLKKLVTAIVRTEIPSSLGIILVGSTLALLQGQFNEFNTLVSSEKKTSNPAILNLLTLESLLLKGNIDEALSYVTKSLNLFTNIRSEQHTQALQFMMDGEEIFTQALAYYTFQLLGRSELASEAFEEANRLQSAKRYQWEYFYFWLVYFKTLITIFQTQSFEEALLYTEDSLQIAIKLENRIFQGLSLQNKGRALIGLGRYLEGLKYYKDALKLFQLTNSVFLIAIFSDLANLEVKVNRYTQAKNFFQKTIIETQLLGGGLDFAPLLQLPGFKGLADLYLLQGNYYLAEEAYLKTLVLSRNAHAFDQESICLEKLGTINTELNKFEIAQNYFIESIEIKDKYSINKATALLEFGRLALKTNNKELALTQLFYLRNLSQTKNLGLEITLFKAQINMLEKKFDEARFDLEKLQVTAKKSFNTFQVRVQLILSRLALLEANLGSAQSIISNKTETEPDETEEQNENIEESTDRIRSILPELEKIDLPALQVLLILVKAILHWLESDKSKAELEYLSAKLNEATKISREQKLIVYDTKIEFYLRRISRLRVRITYNHLYDLCGDIETLLRINF